MNYESNRFIYDHYNGWILVSGPWYEQLQKSKDDTQLLWSFENGISRVEWERLPLPSGRVAWRRVPVAIIPQSINSDVEFIP